MRAEYRVALVSGAAGWLGGNFLRALRSGLPECPGLSAPAGWRVRGFDRPEIEPPAEAELEWVAGDLRRPEDCARFCAGAAGGVLFHLAGVIHPRRVAEFEAVNVEGTRNLLEAAADAGVRRAVVLSSNSPFGGNAARGERFDESSPYRPYRGYGRSKMRMEEVARTFLDAGRLEVAIVRAPWFYGPRQPARQRLFFEMIRTGRAPLVGDGNNERSMSYVDNTAQGLLLAALTPQANGQAYWIADERPYTTREIMDTIENLLETEFGQHCAHRRLRLPNLAGGVAGAMDAALQAAGMYNTKLHVLSEMNQNIACSIERARRELGYAPTVALREGMRRSLGEFYRNDWRGPHPEAPPPAAGAGA